MASDDDEGQGHSPIWNTLSGVSHIFGTHEETDTESDNEEKIQSAQRKQRQPSPKEDTPSKELSESSSEEEQPTDEALRNKARQLNTNLDAWQRKKIAKGIAGWATRDIMICNHPEHGKAQPNHPYLVGPPLDYMGECQVFNGIQSDIYDLCRFYILGTMDDPPEFPTPREPATHGQIRDLLKLARAIGQLYLILAHSADSVTAISMGDLLPSQVPQEGLGQEAKEGKRREPGPEKCQTQGAQGWGPLLNRHPTDVYRPMLLFNKKFVTQLTCLL